MRTLKNRLKEDVKPCYLVSGEDYYLYDKALSMISKAMNLELEDFNKNVFDDDNYDMQLAINTCEIMPMGSEKRLVVIKNITKFNEKDKPLLESYLKNPCKSTVLVILDFNNKFPFAKNICEFVDARRMDRNLARGIVVNELAKKGKQISAEAVETLLEYGNGYLTNVMNELDKLAYYSEDPLITRKIVEFVANKNTEFTVYELTEALGKKNTDKALKLLAQMEKDPITMGLITNHFRRLFMIAISQDYDNITLANLLGVKEYAITKAKEQLNNFSKMQLKKIYALLEEVDFNIKSGQMQLSVALYYLVFSILFV